MQGALGDGLLADIRLAYYFIAQNWSPGDEASATSPHSPRDSPNDSPVSLLWQIFLFGFSRGAYIARLLLTLISIIGILSPRDNLHMFPEAVRLLCSHRDGLSSKAQRNQAELDDLLQEIAPARLGGKMTAGPIVTAVVLFDTVSFGE